MNSEDNLLVLAENLAEEGRDQGARWCRNAAREIEQLHRELAETKKLACYWRDRYNRQTALRCDAQARAGRIARDARR